MTGSFGDRGWWFVGLAGLATVMLWNGSRFIGVGMGVRTKDLTFLPTPEVAQVLACGHAALAAKLRWIDSFDYFELQIDRRNDAVAGEAGEGYTRLYDILLALDPRFRPYYDQAVLNLGAVESRHFQALGIMLRGLLVMPDDHSLWQQAATELYTTYDLERKHPEQMGAFLAQWAAAEPTENAKRTVWDWRAAMDRRQALGLSELPYWQEQLDHTEPGSSAETFIIQTMQELLSRFGRNELQALVDAYTTRHGSPPASLADILDHALLVERYPHGLPPWGPIGADADHHPILLSDPLGYPYRLAVKTPPPLALDGVGVLPDAPTVVSIADGLLLAERRLSSLNIAFLTMNHNPPTSLQGMLDVAHPGPAPECGHWVWRDRQLMLDCDPPPSPAWQLRTRK